MPTYERQQWGRYTFTNEEVKRALLAVVDVDIFPGGPEVVVFGNGTAYIEGFIAKLEPETAA